MLRGLSNIIAGLAPLRNKMGDAHVRSHKPERHLIGHQDNRCGILSKFDQLTNELSFPLGPVRTVRCAFKGNCPL